MNENLNEIIDNLYIGNSKSFINNNFDLIVNCTKEYEIPFSTNNTSMNIRISIKDDPYECDKFLSIINDSNVLDIINDFITNKKTVLVHCSMGMQRSCALVTCYLIKYYSMDYIEAIKYIKSRRPIAFFGNINLLSTIEKFFENFKKNQ